MGHEQGYQHARRRLEEQKILIAGSDAVLDITMNRVKELALALKVASAANYGAKELHQTIWSLTSPFQMKIDKLIGPPPYGDKTIPTSETLINNSAA
jgi:hypothetical protein